MTDQDDKIDEQDEAPNAVPPKGEPVPTEDGSPDDRPPDDGPPDDGPPELEARLKRAMADMANLRKRMHRDVADARQRAIEGLAAELLPVLDNFHLALGVKDQQDAGQGEFDAELIVDGMRMVKSLLESVLERHGLSEIRSEGQTFDPNLHEAVGVDAESRAEPGKITQVMQRGYRFGDKILRASRVVVRGDTDGAPSSRGDDRGKEE